MRQARSGRIRPEPSNTGASVACRTPKHLILCGFLQLRLASKRRERTDCGKQRSRRTQADDRPFRRSISKPVPAWTSYRLHP
jgi:hypothetical protein